MLNTRYVWRFMRGRCETGRRYGAEAGAGVRRTVEQRAGKDYQALLAEYRHKIAFNSLLDAEALRLSYMSARAAQDARERHERAHNFHLRQLPPLPVSLRYLVDKERLLKQDDVEERKIEEDAVFHLPYGEPALVEPRAPVATTPDSNEHKEFDRSNIDRWMTNYDYYDDFKLKTANQISTENFNDDSDDEDAIEWMKRYGTPDPKERISNVPCGGCGALLHCSDTSIPGYIPSEIYKHRSPAELRTIECQRCHFLKEYNIALNVSVHPDEYEQLLKLIENRKALVVLMVDLLDFPCSIWPGIIDIIGTQRPIIIVGNKVDLLPGDGKGYLKRIRDSLLDELKKTRIGEANIKGISLISAKTGYGVEDLISNMFKVWLYKGDVYLIGCTNVGKSSLFNALLQSDYCKVHAVDLIQRATVSRWPGTTLNLLKFPINRPSGFKIHHRVQRLKADAQLLRAEKALSVHQLEGSIHNKRPTLIGHIGQSFVDIEKFKTQEIINDPFSYGSTGITVTSNIGLNDKDELFAKSKWLYDTPGVVHPEQILSMLTAEELLMTLPKTLIRPRSYYLHPGSSILIGGLARLDLLECAMPARFTVFSSNRLPVTITQTEDADRVYQTFLGTELLGVPKGNEERLSQWPGLTKHEEILTFIGEGNRLCCGDVVLSSAGWIALTAPRGIHCKVAAWTPDARGVNVRTPSMLKYAIMLKGKRLRDTPAYRLGSVYTEDKR